MKISELTVVEIEKGKPRIKKSQLGEWSREELEEIVRRCNAFPELYEACKDACETMEKDPVQGVGDWQRGLFCGLEDRNITDRYDACQYGYEKALEKVQEWIIDSLEAVLAKAEEKPK